MLSVGEVRVFLRVEGMKREEEEEDEWISSLDESFKWKEENGGLGLNEDL